jgi:hypothetical protein
MKAEYDLSKLKSRKNPYASMLKKHVTIRLSGTMAISKILNGIVSVIKRAANFLPRKNLPAPNLQPSHHKVAQQNRLLRAPSSHPDAHHLVYQ